MPRNILFCPIVALHIIGSNVKLNNFILSFYISYALCFLVIYYSLCFMVGHYLLNIILPLILIVILNLNTQIKKIFNFI